MAASATKNAKSADGKFADMQKDTIELNDKDHMTTDYGIKISDPDHWLRVADEKKTGPMLLEDQIAREKVCSPNDHKLG
jgi:catalase